MRAAGATLVVLLGAAACDPGTAIKVSCRDSTDCLDGRICTYGICASASAGDAGDAPPVLDGGRVPAPANCNGSSWQPITLASSAEAASLLVGRWIQCGGGAPASLPGPTEFTADGRWYDLVPQSGGSYARAMAYGKWGYYRVTGPATVDLYDAAADPDADAGGSPSEESQIHFSLDPFIMQFDPALYTLLP